jgi:hypothetical protein
MIPLNSGALREARIFFESLALASTDSGSSARSFRVKERLAAKFYA